MNEIDSASASNPLPPRELYGNRELCRLLRPHSIAVVGASATPGSFGHRTLENISIGYTGKIYPINPKYPDLLGHKCYPSIDDLPDVPDCVVVAVVAEQVLPIVERCAVMGVGGTVIYSSGTATLRCHEREASAAQELSGLCDRVPPTGHRRSAKRTVGLG